MGRLNMEITYVWLECETCGNEYVVDVEELELQEGKDYLADQECPTCSFG